MSPYPDVCCKSSLACTRSRRRAAINDATGEKLSPQEAESDRISETPLRAAN